MVVGSVPHARTGILFRFRRVTKEQVAGQDDPAGPMVSLKIGLSTSVHTTNSMNILGRFDSNNLEYMCLRQ